MPRADDGGAHLYLGHGASQVASGGGGGAGGSKSASGSGGNGSAVLAGASASTGVLPTPNVLVYWLGRQLVKGDIRPLEFMKPAAVQRAAVAAAAAAASRARSGDGASVTVAAAAAAAAVSGAVPEKCYRRVHARLFVGGEWGVARSKLSLLDECPFKRALAQDKKLAARHANVFGSWLAHVHETLDQEIFFIDPLRVETTDDADLQSISEVATTCQPIDGAGHCVVAAGSDHSGAVEDQGAAGAPAVRGNRGGHQRIYYARVRLGATEYTVGDRVAIEGKPMILGEIVALYEQMPRVIRPSAVAAVDGSPTDDGPSTTDCSSRGRGGAAAASAAAAAAAAVCSPTERTGFVRVRECAAGACGVAGAAHEEAHLVGAIRKKLQKHEWEKALQKARKSAPARLALVDTPGAPLHARRPPTATSVSAARVAADCYGVHAGNSAVGGKAAVGYGRGAASGLRAVSVAVLAGDDALMPDIKVGEPPLLSLRPQTTSRTTLGVTFRKCCFVVPRCHHRRLLISALTMFSLLLPGTDGAPCDVFTHWNISSTVSRAACRRQAYVPPAR